MDRIKTAAGRPLIVLAALALASVSVVITGCNTVEGAGEDIESAGEGISDASRDVRN